MLTKKSNKTNNDKVDFKEKIEASIMIASFLDTLGFNNGQWEFNYGSKPASTIQTASIINFTLIHHYMSIGGFNYINIKGWNSSDDTILIIATIKALLDNNENKEITFINRYIEIYNELENPERMSGRRTLTSITFLKKIIQKTKDTYLDMIEYGKDMGGNGAAIRTGPIGLFYANDINKVISTSIINSRLTHNIPLGYLGGLISALFAAFAINGVDSWLWIDKLFELEQTIIDYIHTTNIKNEHDKEIKEYFRKWHHYKEFRFDDLLKFRNKSQFIFPNERFLALKEYIIEYKDNSPFNFGSSGLDSVIYAYDSLLLSIIPNENFELDIKTPIYNPESFVFFSTIHSGDSDSTGAIAGFWYGALLGYNGFDKKKIETLEFYNELKTISSDLYNKLK
jgi:ADP-ribosylarginine hydrolase